MPKSLKRTIKRSRRAPRALGTAGKSRQEVRTNSESVLSTSAGTNATTVAISYSKLLADFSASNRLWKLQTLSCKFSPYFQPTPPGSALQPLYAQLLFTDITSGLAIPMTGAVALSSDHPTTIKFRVPTDLQVYINATSVLVAVTVALFNPMNTVAITEIVSFNITCMFHMVDDVPTPSK